MWDQLIDVLGFILGLVFIFLNAKVSKSIVGSAFKRYHSWMMVASLVFSLAFLTDLIAIRNGEIASLDITHHILLLIAAIIFIATNLRLPQEASQYMGLQDKNGAKIK